MGLANTWSAVLGGAIGGAISGALGNITSSPVRLSMLPGIVSGGLSSAFSGSNFLSGAIGGIGYTSTVFNNTITSTDRLIGISILFLRSIMMVQKGQIFYQDVYPLTKEIYAQYVLEKEEVNCRDMNKIV
jgi:hypothetical protein